jgi:hypothetical protein
MPQTGDIAQVVEHLLCKKNATVTKVQGWGWEEITIHTPWRMQRDGD